MRFLLVVFSLFVFSLLKAQIVFDKTKFDFGDLTMTSDRFVDIKITNKSVKKGYILTIKKPADVVYIVNGQFMDKDSSLTLRCQVNPMKKGRFTYEISIFTSDKGEATIIKLTGNLKEFSPETANYLQACPDFNAKKPDKNATDFEVTIVTIDKDTKTILSESTVTMIQNGRPTTAFKTDKKGQFTRKFPLGFSYFYATHDGYFPTEMGAYINFQRNYVMIELEKNKTIEEPIIAPTKEDKPVIDSTTTPVEIELNLEKELAQQTTTPTTEVSVVGFNELDKNNFDVSLFKPVNIVFVLDISASMQAGEKMELMKYSLNKLVEMLRPQDQITLVTYSTDARVLLETIHGDQKDEIFKKVDELKAAGLTAGGDGIKLGYKQSLRHYLNDGVNHLVVITDGAFNRNSGDYKKAIKKYKKKGVNMSVVGVQNSEKDKVNMEEVANLGGGRYIPIYKLVDAQNNLKQEIRYIAFRK